MISCKAFVSDFERRGNVCLQLPEPPYLLVCGRMSSLSIVQKIFDWDDGNNFVWRGSRKDYDTIATHVSVKKKSLFYDKHWGSLGHRISPGLLRKHFINLITRKPYFVLS